MSWPALYFAFYGASFMFGLAAARGVSNCIFPGHYYSGEARLARLVFYAVFVVLVVVPIDKWFDSRIRRLVKL
jgi:hypothetical protein